MFRRGEMLWYRFAEITDHGVPPMLGEPVGKASFGLTDVQDVGMAMTSDSINDVSAGASEI